MNPAPYAFCSALPWNHPESDTVRDIEDFSLSMSEEDSERMRTIFMPVPILKIIYERKGRYKSAGKDRKRRLRGRMKLVLNNVRITPLGSSSLTTDAEDDFNLSLDLAAWKFST